MKWQYRGYNCELNGCSHSCPELKLRGYRDELQLERAINQEIKKRKIE